MMANTPTDISNQIRVYLQSIAADAQPVTYQALARALSLRPPNTIHRVTMALEQLMREDAANDYPFIAALVIGKAHGGLPAPGFFEMAVRLGRGNDFDTRDAMMQFHAAELRAAVAFWSDSK